MQSMSVNHLTSSPYYLQSNGLPEKFVGIIKNLFHKAKEEGQSPYTALMVYRNTPLTGTLQSPMQILQGRQAHTDLPLLHAAKVQMGINHAPQPTAEILHVKDKLLSSPTHDIPIGQNVMYRCNIMVSVSFIYAGNFPPYVNYMYTGRMSSFFATYEQRQTSVQFQFQNADITVYNQNQNYLWTVFDTNI